MTQKDIKRNGVVFTPKELADFMSINALKHISKDKNEEIKILEPSAGDGALAISIVENAIKFGFKRITLYAFDINIDFLNSLKIRIVTKFSNVNVVCICGDFIEYAFNNSTIKADVIISNPPYVRTQNMEKKYIDFANQSLKLSGRIDLYHIFICMLLNVLADSGIVSIVVSNKFISNKAGFSLRQFITENYSIYGIYDFGDSKMFDASVLPAVLVMGTGISNNNDASYYSVYSNDEKNNTKQSIFEAFDNKEKFAYKDGVCYKINYGTLKIENNEWTICSEETEDFLSDVCRNTAFHFSDFAKIKVGIKTTADKIFISDNWDAYGNDKPELLKKLVTHRVANQYFSSKSDNFKVLYPYVEQDGKKKTVDLDMYPNTKKYLLSNYDHLSGRTYIQKSSKEWFEIWVPHTPDKWNKKTIVFRDISEHPTFWIPEIGSVINGDCYWFDFNEKASDDIIFLILAISNSTFIEKYYDLKFNNKLYSGRRRFMTQYVEKFPIFSPDLEEAKKIISIVKKASISNSISKNDIEAINNLVYSGFNRKN